MDKLKVCSSAPCSIGDIFQDPQWMPEITDSIKAYINYVFFLYIYTTLIKLDLYSRHSKKLTKTNKNRIIITVYCNKTDVNLVSPNTFIHILNGDWLQATVTTGGETSEKGLLYIHTIKYYSAIKKELYALHGTTWLNLDNNVSQINWWKRAMNVWVYFCEIFRIGNLIEIQKTD